MGVGVIVMGMGIIVAVVMIETIAVAVVKHLGLPCVPHAADCLVLAVGLFLD